MTVSLVPIIRLLPRLTVKSDFDSFDTTAVPEMVYPEVAIHRPLRLTGSDGQEQFRKGIAFREPLQPSAETEIPSKAVDFTWWRRVDSNH